MPASSPERTAITSVGALLVAGAAGGGWCSVIGVEPTRGGRLPLAVAADDPAWIPQTARCGPGTGAIGWPAGECATVALVSGMSTDAVLTLLQEVAAQVITPRFRSLTQGQIIEKNPGDLVTVADREAEVLITARLQAAFPNAVILGEEAHSADPTLMDRYLAAEHAFTVDPVDGTKNFVHGSPDHAVMVAETRAGETVRAWVWQPEYEVAWVAERGAGTWRNGVRATTSRTRPTGDLVGASSMRALVGSSLGELPPLRLSWVCCGIDYARLIEGAADYVLYTRSHPWDHAPGALLTAEAGGVVQHPDGTDYTPRSLRPGLVVSATPEVQTAVSPYYGDLTVPPRPSGR